MNATESTTSVVVAATGPYCGQLLAAEGFDVKVVAAPAGDGMSGAIGRLAPAKQAEARAYFQARAVADRTGAPCVLGICTLVAVGGRVFGTPFGRLEAAEMLRAVSGTRHEVVTGLALVTPTQRLIVSDVTSVKLSRIPEAIIQVYLASGKWLGVAGTYAVPEMVRRFARWFEGSFDSILGLPVDLVHQMFQKVGLRPRMARPAPTELSVGAQVYIY